ncbi:MAG: helix-turn-helix domain-containing protein, partial [Cyanobium sp.]
MSAELIPQLQRLGQRLAQARQAQGISLDQQAERLHMGPEQLRALEEGNREELPEAVFVVAQARRVAASLGVNIDDDIAALRSNQAFQARPPQPGPAPSAPQPRRPAVQADAAPVSTPSRPPLRLLGLGAALVAALDRRPAAVIETIGVRPGGGADAQVLEVELQPRLPASGEPAPYVSMERWRLRGSPGVGLEGCGGGVRVHERLA